ncbi:hypothetical protein K505DRAFT_344182 [Melanomma pulvis-pyrius CBS 109.77]|uniref:Uncharacterized protein n=1 Tax=Melanomma pulvis-pyrius CBS 109.77 TaxID=1314802 RepID=A0A6A6WQ13_9PLEO|nr:hypothetical protein K505DRAFT_344182 [Melanomma pulvis-pyrius CBS 109.77]
MLPHREFSVLPHRELSVLPYRGLNRAGLIEYSTRGDYKKFARVRMRNQLREDVGVNFARMSKSTPQGFNFARMSKSTTQGGRSQLREEEGVNYARMRETRHARNDDSTARNKDDCSPEGAAPDWLLPNAVAEKGKNGNSVNDFTANSKPQVRTVPCHQSCIQPRLGLGSAAASLPSSGSSVRRILVELKEQICADFPRRRVVAGLAAGFIAPTQYRHSLRAPATAPTRRPSSSPSAPTYRRQTTGAGPPAAVSRSVPTESPTHTARLVAALEVLHVAAVAE